MKKTFVWHGRFPYLGRVHTLVSFLFVLSLIVSCTPKKTGSPDSPSSPHAQEALVAARQAFDVGAFDQAYNNFSVVLRQDPQNTAALLGRGAALLSLGKTKPAMSDFGHVLQYDENNADAFYNLGLALLQLGRTDKSETAFTKAIECNPIFAKAYNNRGLVRVRLSQFDEAEADFSRAFALQNEKDFEPIYNRAALYQMQKKYEKALSDYLVAESISPYSVRVKNNIGVVYIELGKFSDAMNSLDKALSISPNDPEVHYNRAILFEKKNEYKVAIEEYDKALIINPKMAEGYLNRGILYLRLRKNTEGCRDMSAACEYGICDLYESMQSKGLCD